MKAGLIAALLLLMVMIGGCASVSVDNGKCHAQYSSWFKTLDGVSMSACSAQGSAVKSTVDIQDFTDGVMK
jgi:hypothetical protein